MKRKLVIIANSIMDPNNFSRSQFKHVAQGSALALRKTECTVALHKTSVSTRFAFRERCRPSEIKLLRRDRAVDYIFFFSNLIGQIGKLSWQVTQTFYKRTANKKQSTATYFKPVDYCCVFFGRYNSLSMTVGYLL